MRSVSKSPTRSAGNSPSKEVNGRPEMSIAADARASSIGHDRVAEAADAGAVAERLVERLPERDAGVLDGVVRAGLEVALDLHVEVEQAVARDRVEQVVEEADPGAALARARAVEVQRQLDVGLAGGAMDLRGAAHARRSIDSACTGKPSARASAAPAGARRAAASRGKDTRAMRRRNVAGDSADWNRAAPPVGQHMVRAGDVIPERGGRAGADEQAAGVPHPIGKRLRLLSDQLEVLGRDLLGERERHRPRRCVSTSCAWRPIGPGAALEQRRRPRRAARRPARGTRPGCPDRARPGPADRARSARGPRRRRPRPRPARSDPRCRRCRPGPTTWRFASCTYGLPGPTITSTGSHRLRAVCQRGDGLRPAHPVDLGHLAEHAGGEDHRVCAAVRARAVRRPRSRARPRRAR